MKKIVITALLAVCSSFLHAQFDEPMKAFPTPQAAGFGIYGKVPVNGFTGAPDISIPIYEFKCRKLSVPINLSYHVASVKPNLHPGCTGLGWNLLAGGCITRKVNGLPDELMEGTDTENGYFGHYSDISKDDWYSEDKMNVYRNALMGTSGKMYEVMPDEFDFNFCGYSGSFYLDDSGEWQVRSDVNIMVKFDKNTDCISINDVRSNLKSGIKKYEASYFNARLINSFTLITPDGVRYTFGGADATEYSIPYFSQSTGYLVATSWYLTQITSPQGDEIKLTYTPGKPVIEIKPFYTEMIDEHGHGVTSLFKGTEGTRDAVLMLPVYLRSMEISPERVIVFDYSTRSDMKIASEKTYENALLTLDKPNFVKAEHVNVYNFARITIVENRKVFTTGTIDDLIWLQLDRIKIKDGSVQKDMYFNYEADTKTNRLKLKSLAESDRYKYTFSYYYNINEKWPYYYTDQEDFWGFFNNSGELKGMINKGTYSSQRLPSADMDVRTAGILSEITYPTGGKVKFIYEKHDYSKYIDPKNVLEETTSQSTGGIRIKRIVRTNPDQTPAGTTSYFYVDDFITLADTTSGKPSSGILAKRPVYLAKLLPQKFKEHPEAEATEHKYTLFSSGTLGPYIANADGSHIGYSNVIEVSQNEKGKITGYKKTIFSNFGKSATLAASFNEPPLYTLGFADYSACHLSDRSMQRGKRLSETYYSADNKLKKETTYQYSIKNKKKDYIRSMYFCVLPLGEFGVPGSEQSYKLALYYIDAYKTYIDWCNLTHKRESVYDDNQNVSYSYYNYTYNTIKQLISESRSTREGSLITDYKYTTIGENFSVPFTIRKTLSLTYSGLQFLSNEQFYYSTENGIPFLKRYEKAIKDPYSQTEYYRCNKIDQRGNPLSVKFKGEPETVYLWSSDYSSPVAEIKNAGYDEVDRALKSGASLPSLQALFPQSQVTLFEYSPDGRRLWEQNGRGLDTYYKYLPSGSLKAIYDHQGNLLKQYDYEYLNK